MYIAYYLLGIILVPAIILSVYAQIKVQANYKKYSQIVSEKNLTGKEVADLILKSADIKDVSVIEIDGELTDYYDSKKKVLALSKNNFNSASIASMGVTAHECGHAIQDKEGYVPNKIRNVVVHVYNIASKLLMPIIIIGFLFDFLFLLPKVANIIMISGLVVFGLSMIFNLVTLPVEFNASSRALKILESSTLLNSSELEGAKKVLRSAALTYVAAFLYSFLQFLRILLIFSNRNRD